MTNDDWPTPTNFPKISGQLVNLRGLLIGDANNISRLMTYNISKSLWEVPYPYSLEHARSSIDSSHKDFESLRAVNFAILYKNNPEGDRNLVGIISLKNIDLV
jgi:[ribosomal protein S5]-alanine N-acetyltransferase